MTTIKPVGAVPKYRGKDEAPHEADRDGAKQEERAGNQHNKGEIDEKDTHPPILYRVAG